MDSEAIKNLIVGSIRHSLDTHLRQVEKLGGAEGKAPAAIKSLASSLIDAAERQDARVYEDYEFSAC